MFICQIPNTNSSQHSWFNSIFFLTYVFFIQNKLTYFTLISIIFSLWIKFILSDFVQIVAYDTGYFTIQQENVLFILTSQKRKVFIFRYTNLKYSLLVVGPMVNSKIIDELFACLVVYVSLAVFQDSWKMRHFR